METLVVTFMNTCCKIQAFLLLFVISKRRIKNRETPFRNLWMPVREVPRSHRNRGSRADPVALCPRPFPRAGGRSTCGKLWLDVLLLGVVMINPACRLNCSNPHQASRTAPNHSVSYHELDSNWLNRPHSEVVLGIGGVAQFIKGTRFKDRVFDDPLPATCEQLSCVICHGTFLPMSVCRLFFWNGVDVFLQFGICSSSGFVCQRVWNIMRTMHPTASALLEVFMTRVQLVSCRLSQLPN